MKKAFIYLMALAYCLAGVNHFVHPEFYRPIMPRWLPYHDLLIYLSGAAELLLGILLVPAFTRRFAGWGLIAFLVAVFPANVQMMLDYTTQHHPRLWLAVLRLPLQALLIYWAYLATLPVHKRFNVKSLH